MFFRMRRGGGDLDLGRLIARGRYQEARALLGQELRQDPGSVSLRLRLADVLALEGRTTDALRLLGRLSEELHADGFEQKAAAVLKKMQRLHPSLPSLAERLAALAPPVAVEAGPAMSLAA